MDRQDCFLFYGMYTSVLYSCMMMAFFLLKSRFELVFSSPSIITPCLIWSTCRPATCWAVDNLPKYKNLHLPLLNLSVILLSTCLGWQNNFEFQPVTQHSCNVSSWWSADLSIFSVQVCRLLVKILLETTSGPCNNPLSTLLHFW